MQISRHLFICNKTVKTGHSANKSLMVRTLPCPVLQILLQRNKGWPYHLSDCKYSNHLTLNEKFKQIRWLVYTGGFQTELHRTLGVLQRYLRGEWEELSKQSSVLAPSSKENSNLIYTTHILYRVFHLKKRCFFFFKFLNTSQHS